MCCIAQESGQYEAQGVPDNEIHAGNSRIEEDDAIDNEGNGLPEGIKGAAGLDLDVDVPFVCGRTIQTIHCHSNHTCTNTHFSLSTVVLQLHSMQHSQHTHHHTCESKAA